MKHAALLLALTAIACTTTTPPPAPAASAPVAETQTAPPGVDEATRGAIAQLESLLEQQPANMPYIYILATLYDRAGDAGKVVKWLTRLDELGWEQSVALNAFPNTREHPSFREIAARLDAREPRVRNAQPAFTLAGQRDLVPEGIAYDPVDDVFYVTGIYRRKVLRVDRAGNARDFVGEAQDGMLGGLGVKVDEKRRLLWVVSGHTNEMKGRSEQTAGRSMLAAYDLRDGRLVKKVESTGGMLNDLALLDDGTIYVTDTMGQRVMRLAPGAGELEVYLEDFRYPNGIAVTPDQRHLYVADFRGLTRVDLAGKSRTRIEADRLLGGIDGLTYHEGALIGIQNALGKPRVIRIDPAAQRVEILEAKNELFELPTTGVAVGDDYYFIANPGLRSFDANGAIWPHEKLEDPVLLKLAL